MLTVVLSAFAWLPAMAQQSQDALYIFRNDGQFNAFFWGDIERIEYSRVDTFGIERHDYVVQEIYALDSVFRIPLSAIDSVSFVTPETQYKKDVVRPDKSIADYIVASDSVSWIRLAPNTPSALIPKKGDKIFIKEFSRYIPDGFVGLVTSVTSGEGGYTVMTDELELVDIFDRLVVKTAAASVEDNTAAVRRRGLFDGTEMNYTNEEPIELPPLAGSIPFTGSYAMGKLGPVSISGDVAGAFNYGIKRKLEIRAFLFVDALKAQFKYDQNVKSYNEVDLGGSLVGTMTGSVDFPLKGVSKSLSDFFRVNVTAGLFVGAQFSAISINYTRKYNVLLHTQVVADEKDVPLIPGEIPIPFHRYHYDVALDTTEFSANINDKYSFSAGVYAEISLGVRYPFKKWDTSANKDKLGVGVKLRAELGGKLEFSVPKLDLPLVFTDKPLPQLSLYRLLNTQTDISLMGYGKLSLSGELGKWKGSIDPELDVLKTGHFGVVPDITGISVSQDRELPIRPYRHLMTAPLAPDRKLLMSKDIGFAVFDKDGKLVTDSISDYYLSNGKCTDTGWERDGLYRCVFTNIDPVKSEESTYTAYPMVKYDGWKLLVDKKREFTLDSARIDVKERLIEDIKGEGGSRDVEVIPNMSNVEVESEDESWLTFVWLDHKNELAVFYKALPKGVHGRRGVIRLTGKTQKGEKLIEDSVVVCQGGGYIAVHPEKLTFDIDGGTKTVTIDSTNVKEIIVRDTPRGIHATLKDNVLTITVDKNTDYKYTDFVILEGETDNGQKASVYITIEQDGKDPDAPDPGETIAIETFKCSVRAGNTKLVSCSDPDIHWGMGYGPQPWGWSVGYDAEKAPKLVTATIGSKAINFVVHADNDEYTTYRDENSPIYDGTPLAGNRSYTLTFDIEKYLDDEGKPAARVTNMSMSYSSKETWPNVPDFGYYEDYELHRISATVDPSEVKASIDISSKFDYVDGKFQYIPIGYKSIMLSGRSEFYSDAPYEGEDVRIGSYSYDFTFHYYEYRDKEWKKYDASYVQEGQSAKNSIFLKVTFPTEVHEKLMQWFKDQ